MIVRDEAPVIARCLSSVLPLVDHWVVVDTGSADGTQDIVRRCLAGIPGELVERPWVDFAHNRTEAFGYASTRADYVLVIDADEVLRIMEQLPRAAALASGAGQPSGPGHSNPFAVIFRITGVCSSTGAGAGC